MRLPVNFLAMWRRPWRALVVLALLGLVGLSGYVVLRSWQRSRHLEQAREAAAGTDLAGARERLMTLLAERPDDPEVRLLLARVARRAGAYAEALERLRECEHLGGVSEAIELERLLQRAQRGDFGFGDALLWAYAEKGHPDAPLILEAMARGYLETFRLSHAAQCLELWLRLQPDSVQALVWRGKLLDHQQNNAEAIASYARALELDPDNKRARLQLADLLERSAQPLAALEHYQVLQRKDPDNQAILLGLARTRITINQPDEARRVLDDFLARFPPHPDALLQRGRLELLALQPARAEPWLRKAVALAPYEREAVYSLAQCLKQLGKKDELPRWQKRLKSIDDDQARLAVLTRKVLESPRDPSPRCEAGKIFLGIGNEKEGLRWLGSALQEDPGYRPAHEALAAYYREKGQPALAAPHEQVVRSSKDRK